MVGQFGTKFRAFALCKQVHLVLAQMVIVRWAEQSSLLLVSKHGAVRPQKPYGLLGTGRRGVWRWGEREIIYLSLHCHHQNDFWIKMGSDESHFNVSVGSDGQSHKTESTNHNLSEEEGEPKRYRTEVLPLNSLTPYRWATPAHLHPPFADYDYIECSPPITGRYIRIRKRPGSSNILPVYRLRFCEVQIWGRYSFVQANPFLQA